VTHDQEEAMVMSDRIALLRSGELEQVAAPREIYSRPQGIRRAIHRTHEFIGSRKCEANRALLVVYRGHVRLGGRAGPISLRPENIVVVRLPLFVVSGRVRVPEGW